MVNTPTQTFTCLSIVIVLDGFIGDSFYILMGFLRIGDQINANTKTSMWTRTWSPPT